jgi:hypothetical protein
MVHVSLRHKGQPAGRSGFAAARTPAAPERATEYHSLTPWIFALVAVAVLATGVLVYFRGLQQDALDLVTDATRVPLEVAHHRFMVPANMLRTDRQRRGGQTDAIDMALHWPELSGYSDATAADFASGDPRAPIIYVTIGPRLAPLDATARLDTVYARFFTGKAVAGPSGLVGRMLSAGSGFDGEVIYFQPSAQQPFVARCPATATAEMPATCLRDINIGTDLTILFRFDKNLLGQWQPLEAGVRRLAADVAAP